MNIWMKTLTNQPDCTVFISLRIIPFHILSQLLKSRGICINSLLFILFIRILLSREHMLLLLNLIFWFLLFILFLLFLFLWRLQFLFFPLMFIFNMSIQSCIAKICSLTQFTNKSSLITIFSSSACSFGAILSSLSIWCCIGDRLGHTYYIINAVCEFQ